MKKNFFLFIALLPLTLYAQNALDTMKLKNGEIVTGYIYKFGDGLVCIAKQKDTSIYTPDQIQSIMFCHTVRSKPCVEGSSSSKSNTSSSSSSSYSRSTTDHSTSGNPCDVNKEEKGNVVFQCSDCTGSGSFQLRGGSKTSKTVSNFTYTLDKKDKGFEHAQFLDAGEYNWTFTNANKQKTKGKFTIQKGEERKIDLKQSE
jgi:hypothetical protein